MEYSKRRHKGASVGRSWGGCLHPFLWQMMGPVPQC